MSGNVIYSYTARQAVEDGVLVDVPDKLCCEAGFRWPVRITRQVLHYATPGKRSRANGETLEGRLWDMLSMLGFRVRSVRTSDRTLVFTVKFGKHIRKLWAVVDTTSGPAIHIMTPEEY